MGGKVLLTIGEATAEGDGEAMGVSPGGGEVGGGAGVSVALAEGVGVREGTVWARVMILGVAAKLTPNWVAK